MATVRLSPGLPCSWNGYVLGFSFSILKSRKNAFVEKKNRVRCYPAVHPVAYKGMIHGLSISRRAPVDYPKKRDTLFL